MGTSWFSALARVVWAPCSEVWYNYVYGMWYSTIVCVYITPHPYGKCGKRGPTEAPGPLPLSVGTSEHIWKPSESYSSMWCVWVVGLHVILPIMHESRILHMQLYNCVCMCIDYAFSPSIPPSLPPSLHVYIYVCECYMGVVWARLDDGILY